MNGTGSGGCLSRRRAPRCRRRTRAFRSTASQPLQVDMTGGHRRALHVRKGALELRQVQCRAGSRPRSRPASRGSRGRRRPARSAGSPAESARPSSPSCSRDQSAVSSRRSSALVVSTGSSPEVERERKSSELPKTHGQPSSRNRSTHSFGCGPPWATSPSETIRSSRDAPTSGERRAERDSVPVHVGKEGDPHSAELTDTP